MFLVRYATNAAGTTFAVARLSPAPLEAIYPEEPRIVNELTTQDGAVVFQRPAYDSRPREWGWVGYRPTTPGYASLWTLLLSLDAKARRAAGRPETIQIWEDTTEAGGFGYTTDGLVANTALAISTPNNPSNLKWTSVRVAQVGRTVDRTAGGVRYERTWVRFYIDDLDVSSTYRYSEF